MVNGDFAASRFAICTVASLRQVLLLSTYTCSLLASSLPVFSPLN